MGFDPKLDSAPKVWTTFAVAKYYEIKHSKLDDYIFSWLRAYPNSYFLEVLPEVSLQIAEGLENYELARDTFAILVGEEALDNLRRARIPNINNKLSTYGRKKEELPEHIHTRVEYASKSFLERIGNEFAEFAGDGMLWIENLPEFQKLESHTQPKLQVTIQELKILLKDYVRGTIYNLLCVNYKSVPAQDLPHPGGKDLFPRMSRSDVWTNNLSINERILSRTFWQALSSFNLFEGRSNFDIKEGWGNQWDLTKLSNIEKDELNYGRYRQVETLDLKRLVREGNRLLDEGPSQPSFPLPIRSLPGAHVPSTESNVQLTDLMQSSQDSIGAQTTQLESNTPTQPIDILQPSRNGRAIFDRGHTSMPDNRSIVQGRGAQWPFGAPRQDSALDVLRNMNDSYMSTMNHQMESGFPAPDGFSSWTISAITNDNKQVDKIDSTQQAEATGRSASIFTMRTEQVGNGLPHELPDSHDKTWSNPIRGTGEIDEDLSMQQPDPSGRSTPPFFRDDNALPQQSSTQNKKTKGPWSQPGVQKFFNLEEFFLQASGYITGFARNKLHPSDQFERPDPFELGITNTLVCLQDSEWKYLPLWAGGNDDGSGGVFNDQIPMADLGFSTAGPDVHTGVTPASSSRASSEFEVIGSAHSDAISTFNTSMANNRGFSDHMHRGRVYAADTADAASSHQDDDSFTVVTDDDEEDAARRQLEVHERIEAAEEAAAKEARMIEKGKGTVEDENYADLFGSQDDEGDETERAEVGDFDDDEMDEDEDKSEDEDMVLV